jgi:hypothetical protein
LGNHDDTNSLQRAAAPVIAAAVELSRRAEDRDAARLALAQLEDAIQRRGGAPLPWRAVGDIKQVMLAVPLWNLSLRRAVGGRRFERRREQSAGLSAALAAIAHVAMLDHRYCATPADQAKWREFCQRMRDHAGACNQAVHANDQQAAREAMREMTRACDDCHDHFQVD